MAIHPKKKQTQFNTPEKSPDEIEYTNLKNFFKWLVGASLISISLLGAYWGITSSNNTNALNQGFSDQKEKMDEDLTQMRNELQEANKEIYELQSITVQNLLDYQLALSEQAYNRIDAIGQSSEIIAENTARERIAQVFSDKNIQSFITTVIEDTLESRIGEIAGKQISESNNKLIDQALSDLESNVTIRVIKGVTFFQLNQTIQINPIQNQRLINIITAGNLNKEQNDMIINFLVPFESEINTKFFNELLKKDFDADTGWPYAIAYFARSDFNIENVISSIYRTMTKTKPSALAYLVCLDACKNNPQYAIKILNNHRLSTYLYENSDDYILTQFKKHITTPNFSDFIPMNISVILHHRFRTNVIH